VVVVEAEAAIPAVTNRERNENQKPGTRLSVPGLSFWLVAFARIRAFVVGKISLRIQQNPIFTTSFAQNRLEIAGSACRMLPRSSAVMK
jgi:hypothetical protein